MTKFHLAQINIAKARDAMDSETMRDFADRRPAKRQSRAFALQAGGVFPLHSCHIE
ncbi:MAG: hypothetical protein ACI82A_003149 [Candidatus Azotimanducaceae bacterium]|jgi:hypothetical protein